MLREKIVWKGRESKQTWPI